MRCYADANAQGNCDAKVAPNTCTSLIALISAITSGD